MLGKPVRERLVLEGRVFGSQFRIQAEQPKLQTPQMRQRAVRDYKVRNLRIVALVFVNVRIRT
jgi:hypothetical protein